MELLDLAAQQRRIQDSLSSRLSAVLAHGRFINGPEVEALEEQLSSRLEGGFGVLTCSNGTDAIELALRARNVGPGDTVLVPSFTFTATAEAVALVGATPAFCDVDATTMNLCPHSFSRTRQALARSGARVVGCIAVDLFGLPADYRSLMPEAQEHGMWVLADAAQAFGATSQGRQVGTLADVTTTSFFPSKPLGCYGDGGAVIAPVDDVPMLRSLGAHGRGDHKYDTQRVGRNARLDTLQAAVLLAKLEVFDEELQKREALAGAYSDPLSELEWVTAPHPPPGLTSAWAQYTVQIGHGQRDELQRWLASVGVPTSVYYPRPLHLQPAYEHYPRDPRGCQVSEDLALRVLSLPMHPYLTLDDVARVTEALYTAPCRP